MPKTGNVLIFANRQTYGCNALARVSSNELVEYNDIAPGKEGAGCWTWSGECGWWRGYVDDDEEIVILSQPAWVDDLGAVDVEREGMGWRLLRAAAEAGLLGVAARPLCSLAEWEGWRRSEAAKKESDAVSSWDSTLSSSISNKIPGAGAFTSFLRAWPLANIDIDGDSSVKKVERHHVTKDLSIAKNKSIWWIYATYQTQRHPLQRLWPGRDWWSCSKSGRKEYFSNALPFGYHAHQQRNLKKTFCASARLSLKTNLALLEDGSSCSAYSSLYLRGLTIRRFLKFWKYHKWKFLKFPVWVSPL